MKTKFLVLLAATAVALMGCSLDQINLLPTAKIRAQISALNVDGEITRATGAYSVNSTTQTITFQSARGSMGAVVTGFEARYEDQSGNSVQANPRPQTLNQVVAPGQTCDKDNNCVFTVGEQSKAVSASLLSEEVAVLYLQASALKGTPVSGWRARITFFATNSNGVAFSWEEVQAITCANCSIK